MKDKDLKQIEAQKQRLEIAKMLREKHKQAMDKEEDKENKFTDPLKNMKAIVKLYGTHNRLQ